MKNEDGNLTLRIDQIAGLLASFSNSLRQLSLSALDLQALALSKKHQIEHHIERIDDLGVIISKLIHSLSIIENCQIQFEPLVDETIIQNNDET